MPTRVTLWLPPWKRNQTVVKQGLMELDSSVSVTVYSSATDAYRKTLGYLNSFNISLFSQVYRGSKVMLNICISKRSPSKRIPQKVITRVKKPSVTLHDAHASDIGALARIHVAAFQKDRYVHLMYNECSHWKAINAMLESRHAQTDRIFQVALTGPKDRIAGWLCCSLVGHPKSPGGSLLAHHELTTALARVVDVLQDDLTRKSGDREDPAQHQRRKQLGGVVLQNATDAQVSAMGDQRYLVINTIVTDPNLAGQGVGSDLLAWLMRYADHEKLRIWAQVSPAAASTFERAGFEEVAIMGLDLENFRQGDRTDNGQALDLYEFRFMSREPGRRLSR